MPTDGSINFPFLARVRVQLKMALENLLIPPCIVFTVAGTDVAGDVGIIVCFSACSPPWMFSFH